MAHPSPRQTVQSRTPITVFLIGMRINTWSRPDKWLPVLTAFPRMLRHLEQDPTSGLLHATNWLGRTTISVQYWRDAETLQAFAAAPDAPHLAPWRRFKQLGAEGHVGIWHETYVVPAGGQESIYVNMPATGLGAALGVSPLGPGLHTAKARLAHVH